MKGKKFYLILIGLIVVGIGSIYLFRQQQESRFMEFEGYEIREVATRVDELYNEDKSDIVDDISEEELSEIDEEIADLREQDFSKPNERRLDDVELDYLIARELNTIQLDINELFVEEDIVDQETTITQIDGLEQQVLEFEIKEGFAKRNMSVLDNARDQMIDIETATEYVEGLFNEEEDVVRTDVTREEEEEALELIEPIRNEDIKDELIARVEVVSLALTEMEEALALEEELEALEEEAALEEAEELEEEDTEYSAPTSGGNSGSMSNSPRLRPGNNSSDTNNSGGLSGSGSQEQSGNTNNSGSSSELGNEDSDTDTTEDATETDNSNGSEGYGDEGNSEGDEESEGTGGPEESVGESSDDSEAQDTSNEE